MKYKIALTWSWLILWPTSIHAADIPVTELTLREWARHSVEFFLPQGEVGKGCAAHTSYLGWKGQAVVDKDGNIREDRAIVATSRMAYGLAKTADLYSVADAALSRRYLEASKRYVDFILENMVKTDADGAYFLSAVDGAGNDLSTDGNQILRVEEQAYGLSGLVALYLQTQDARLKGHIQQLYAGFYRRFHDETHLGFFDRYDRNAHQPVANAELNIVPKSFNSTAYVVSAFLYELAVSGVETGHPTPRDTVMEIGDIMAKHFPDPQTGWIFENFAEDWRVVWHGWQKQPEGTVASVGHNYQAAWLLLQLAELEGMETPRAQSYVESARQILQSLLKKPAFDPVYGGFFRTFLRETDAPIWIVGDTEGPNAGYTSVAWWEHIFGILALSQAEKLRVLKGDEFTKAQRMRNLALAFYNRSLIDRVHGGEFFAVKRDGSPIYAGDEGLKGTPGKSAHHTLQLSWYLTRYRRRIHLGMTWPTAEIVVPERPSPFPVGSPAWHAWYYDTVPQSQVDWYPGKHISGHYGGAISRSQYPEIFGYPPGR